MKGWFMPEACAEHYEYGVSREVTRSNKNSAYLKAKSLTPESFGNLMQVCKADKYRGKRVRFAAYIKAQEVAGWTGLWLRVDGPADQKESLNFDNSQYRPDTIRGTQDWYNCEIVLDVPVEGVSLAFGFILQGAGQAWMTDLVFEEVSKEVPVTNRSPADLIPLEPQNLDFSE